MTTATRVSPWLSVADAKAAVDFYARAFGAVETHRLDDGVGGVAVANLTVDDADFWVQQDVECSPTAVGALSVRMILTVDDPDALFGRALAAGASEVSPMGESHGWRVGRLAAPDGHHWEIGRPLGA